MNFTSILFLLLSIEVQFGVTKWNFITKCDFSDNETHVNYECEDKDDYVKNSDLSCCTLGCHYNDPYRSPSTIKTLKFVNCKVSRLGIVIFEKYQLVELDLSNMDLEALQSDDFNLATELQKLNVSHNRLTNVSTGLFENTPKLDQVDFSFNEIQYVDVDSSENNKIEIINLSHNQIRTIENQTFASFAAVIELNLEHNLIETIDTNFFSNNVNLKRLRLDGNQLKAFICSGYFVIYEMNLSYRHLKKFNGKCIHDSLEINIQKEETEDFPLISQHSNRLDEGTWVFDEDDLSETESLNISNNHFVGVHGIIDRLREPLKSLDVTGNILGTLGANTFDKLINLEKLVLRNTSLTTIKFGLFHHQKNLRLLDISYNNLNKIQFKAFGRNLVNLKSFYLDGNNLSEIDGLKKELFPNVGVLGISDNNFTCEYLVDYLQQWNGVKLIEDKLSNQDHVEKIACDKQFIDHFPQSKSSTTTISTTPEILTSTTPASTIHDDESTTAESTTVEFTTAESTTAESSTAESPTAESPTAESTTAESTTVESTTVESTTAESTKVESTSAETRTPEYTMPPFTTHKRIEATSTLLQVQENLLEKYLSDIFIVLVFISVILSLICIMAVINYSMSMWLNRKTRNIKSFELEKVCRREKPNGTTNSSV